MSIHAQKTTFRSSANHPDFLVTGPMTNGQLLCYSEIAKAFVNKDAASIITGGSGGGGGGGGGTIVGATNIGTGAQIFESINLSDEIQFRTLLGGQGITLAQGANEIEIINSILADAAISVPHSFTLTIDNDDTTVSDAIFGINTNSNPASVTVSPIVTFNAPTLDILVVLPNQFTTAAGDFLAAGFEAGMCLGVNGTTEQDGIWVISSVTADTIIITVPFTNQTDAGLQPATTMEGMYVDFTATTIQLLGRDFAQDGFVTGYVLEISGSTGNDGTYSVALVVGDTLHINETFPAPGCDVGTITLEVPVQDHPTGWYVNELGQMWSNDTIICGDVDVICDGDINIDTGALNLGGVDILDIINNSGINVPNNGFIVQTFIGSYTAREIEVGIGLSITDGDGMAGNPLIAVDSFDITLAGDVTGTATVTGLTDTTINNIELASVISPGIFDTVTVDAKGRVISGTLSPSGINQPADPALDDLAGGMTSPGYVVWNGTNYIDRTITGFANEIEIANAGGQFANTIIGLADNPVLPGVSAMTIPRGFDSDRPATPVNGMMRYRLNGAEFFEGYVDGQWLPFMMDDGGSFLPLSGGVMSGNIDMDGGDILNINLADGRDIAADGIILDNINTGVGIKAQTGASTFVNREIEGVAPIFVINGDGQTGNPTVEFDMMLVPALEIGQIVDEDNDSVLIYDDSQSAIKRVTPKQLFNHPAREYFRGQF